MQAKVTIEQWQAFHTVVEEGSYVKAAKYLNRSQSSVSYNINKLEHLLGVEVFTFEGRKAKLTAAGQVLVKGAKRLSRDALALEQLAASLATGREAEINLVVDAAFPPALLIEALNQFSSSGCHTQVQLREVVMSGSDEALLSGEADLVIGGRVPSGFLGEPLVEVEFVAVAHPDHRLFELGCELGEQDLQTERQVVIRDSGHENRDDGWLGAKQRWTVSSIGAAITLISHGMGFGWLPKDQISEELASGKLKRLPLTNGQSRLAVLYLTPGHPASMGPATKEMQVILTRVSAG